MNENNDYTDAVNKFIALWESGTDRFEAYTSGSTGVPKRIILSRQLMEESALRSIRHFSLAEDSRIHLILSPDYIAGKMCIVRALVSGCHLSFEPPSSHPLASMDQDSEITLLSAVGAQLEGLYDLYTRGSLPHIKHLLLGGAPLNEQMRQKALPLAQTVWESYGMTETASHIALRNITCGETFFTPLDGIRVSLNLQECLSIDMPVVGHLDTNDMADIRPDGKFRILGRIDNVIISGGLKIHPESVEQKLSPFFKNITYFISSKPHHKWGEQVILVVEDCSLAAPCTKTPDEYYLSDNTSLSTVCKRILPAHERPAVIIFTPAIPRTSTGKLIRRRHD